MSVVDTAQWALDWRNAIAISCRTAKSRPIWLKLSESKRSICAALPGVLEESTIIIWEKDIFELARRGMDSFIGISALPSEIGTKPFEPQFWFFNNFHLPMADGLQVEAAALLDIPATGFCFVEFYNSPNECTFQVLPIQLPLTSKSAASVLALYSFMNLKIASREPVLLPRGNRRRLQREGLPVPDIRIIQLRERESGTIQTNAEREYHHRWIRSGSWHRLPQPLIRDSKISGGKKGDEVVWHRPAVCGPAGAPLLQPRRSVYVVAR